MDPGRMLLHYRLVEQLGEGGMGVVWKALDTTLDREVAIKILPEAFAGDAERLARFEREAKAVAALNHPGIVTIHSVEKADGLHFIVMELVQGRTLSEQIPSGGLPLERFFELAVTLSDAVGAAHRQGITHRDLKPGNVMVTDDGRLKVLDFGLAKLVTDFAGSDGSSTALATQTVTRAGTVIGTAAYMSPEQAEGGIIDARSDIFSLGIVLYEMATGERPFKGDSAARIVSSILRDEPPVVSDLRNELPQHLDLIIRRCLEKDPQHRTQSALDARNQLADLRDEIRLDERVARTARRRTGSKAGWLALGLVVAALVVGVIWLTSRESVDRPGVSADRPGSSPFADRKLSQVTIGQRLEQWPAWSPDGTRLIYSAETAGFSKLFVRSLADGVDEQLTKGSGDDIQAAWSPDAASIAFVRSNAPHGKLEPGDVLSGEYDGGDIWIKNLASGEEQKIIEEGFNPAFSPDGSRIAFDAEWAGPRRIWITDVRGHNPEQATTDLSEAVVHTLPSWSPEGSRIVFQNAEKTKFDIKVVDLNSGQARSVTDDGFLDLDPVWSASGEYVYLSSYRGGGLNIWRIPVSPDGRPQSAAEQLTTGAGQDIQPALDSSGSRLSFAVLQQNADVWKLPVDPRTGEPTGQSEPVVVSTREDSRAAWSPEGDAIAFNSDRDGQMNIWIHSLADGTARRLTRGAGGDFQPTWSPDGKSVVFFSARAGNADIWIANVANGELRQVTDDPGLDINPFFSPNGQRIAFQSDRDGRMELWVVNPDGTGLKQVGSSGASGHFMRWSADGRSVVYRTGGATSEMRSIPVDGGEATAFPKVAGGAHISFSPDRRLIMDAIGHKSMWITPVDGSPPRKIFEFSDPDIRIDYPVWSPDGAWISFDRVAPQGGDVWLLEGLD